MTDTEVDLQTKLDKLLLSEDLEELNNLTNQFNVFNALKLQNNEIRHSNFLGWLMAPYENHDLGDYFLKEFLKSAIKDYSTNDKTDVSLYNIAFSNFSDAEIRREYKNIDILIISPQNNFLCVVENKIWTGEHDDQLKRYAEIVDSEFNGYKKLYIFLTPEIDSERELIKRDIDIYKSVHYIPMGYEQVYEVINKVLKFKSKHLNNEVKIFIEHYKRMIERNIMGNTDKKIVDLCRKIYRENKEAIDLINENTDEQAELFEILKEVLEEKRKEGIIDDIVYENNNVIFLPSGLNNKEKLRFANWKPDNYITRINIVNFKWGKPMYIEILIGETNDNEKRAKLLNHIKNLEQFRSIKFNGNEKWAYTRAVNLIKMEDYYNYDCDKQTVKEHISDAINKTNYVNILRDALNSWNP